MSIVNIVKHNETIYNLIPPPESCYELPVTYNIKWKKEASTPRTGQRKLEKKVHRRPAIGVAILPKPDPNKYLRRREGLKRWEPPPPIFCHPKIKPCQIDNKQIKRTVAKPPGGCDFIRWNALSVIRHRRRLAPLRIVDTPRGHRKDLPKQYYIWKEGYGKVPEFVSKRVGQKFADLLSERAQETEKKKIYQEDPCIYKMPRYITAPEREEILAGLKANWTQAQKEFLLLPMHTDTPPKIKRKWMMEKKLESLEADIRRIEEAEYIYVLDDEKQPIL